MRFRESDAPEPVPALAYAVCDEHAGDGPAPCSARVIRERATRGDGAPVLDMRKTLAEFEERLVLAAVESMPNLKEAARALGIDRVTLYRRLARLKRRPRD